MKYTLSKVQFRDSQQSTRPVEHELKSITLHTYMNEFKSIPNITTAVLEDDVFYVFIEGNKVRRFRKADVIRVEYEFDGDMQVEDFIK